ncbi:ribonuclease III [Verrucomicrobiales bacterium]|nr:ribonuclease III [Verrucomicrobiales bacterium]
MESLEEKIGYKFTNSLLLAEALTHPSLAYETRKPHFDNQRLEYLGDAVIQLILTNELFLHFPDFGEGPLTKLRSRLVSRTGLKSYAKSIDLGSYLLLGKGEESSGGRNRPSNLADAFEALFGAIFLDGGYDAARDCLLGKFSQFIKAITDEPEEVNPKGQLQELLQAISPNSPSYRITSQEGPDHQKSFISEVSWNSNFLGKGSGPSKKEAQIAAASDAMKNQLWLKDEEAAKNL